MAWPWFSIQIISRLANRLRLLWLEETRPCFWANEKNGRWLFLVDRHRQQRPQIQPRQNFQVNYECVCGFLFFLFHRIDSSPSTDSNWSISFVNFSNENYVLHENTIAVAKARPTDQYGTNGHIWFVFFLSFSIPCLWNIVEHSHSKIYKVKLYPVYLKNKTWNIDHILSKCYQVLISNLLKSILPGPKAFFLNLEYS